MKILHFLVVPSGERFAVLGDAITAAHGHIGVAAVYDNGLQVLLRENITLAEFHRVAREHQQLVRMRYVGKRGPWYEVEAV